MFLSSWFNRVIVDRNDIRIYFGGAGSGKSVSTARSIIIDMMYGQRNFLVVRKVFGTIRESFYTELECAIEDLGLGSFFTCNVSPMMITHTTGKKIMFRGLDKAVKIKSIRSRKGAITDIVVEEATEMSEDDYDMLDTRLRGLATVKKRITLLFNPIYKEHWLYERFFERRFSDIDKEVHYTIPIEYVEIKDGVPTKVKVDKDVHIHKSTHQDNEFLMPEDHARYEAFKTVNPYYYDVYCCGNWGVLGDLIFDNVVVRDLSTAINQFGIIKYGLDWGTSPDPVAFVATAIKGKCIYIFKEWGGLLKSNKQIVDAVKPIVGDRDFYCDSNDKRAIMEVNLLGLKAHRVAKWQDNNITAIQYLNNYTMVVDYRCKEFLSEVRTYAWKKDADGKAMNEPEKKRDHYLHALFYALNDEIGQTKPGRIGV